MSLVDIMMAPALSTHQISRPECRMSQGTAMGRMGLAAGRLERLPSCRNRRSEMRLKGGFRRSQAVPLAHRRRQLRELKQHYGELSCYVEAMEQGLQGWGCRSLSTTVTLTSERIRLL